MTPSHFNGSHADGSHEQEAGLSPVEESTLGLEPILRFLEAGERFLVCSHSRPDGDAVGSMLAMGMLLRQMGKRADLVTADRIPVVYRSLPGADEIGTVIRVHGPYDAVVLLECDGLERTRLRGLDSFFQINIDHHASGKLFGDLNWIDQDACSVGQMVHRLIKAAGATVTAEMATCLYVTLLTDTGGFCYGNIQAETFALAAELTQAGADPAAVARGIYFANPMPKIMLLGRALNRLQSDGPLAWLWVTHQDMIELGAAEEDCEGVANYALSIAGIEAAIFLRELPEGRIRLSLRRKTQDEQMQTGKAPLNVAEIAELLGGGGHENAAGCTLEGPIERATSEMLGILRRGLQGIAPQADTPDAAHGS
jgi:phosphoesterase RecJ-like protein